LDTQVVELLGRQRLIAELVCDGLEVALPVRDRGVDLIAYADLSRQVARFAARPIQMKASTASGFGVFSKYERLADLILAYVWHLGGPEAAVTYAMTYPQAVALADAQGWTGTASWETGGYSTSRPSQQLLGLLEPYRMGPGRWWSLVTGAAPDAEPDAAVDRGRKAGPGH
jgi:hypothetical protein